MQVHFDTLKVVDGQNCTIDITINGKTQTVRAWNTDCRDRRDNYWLITIYGIACRFRSGNKVWPAEILYWPLSKKITGLKPRNYTRCNKPTLVSLAGFESDFEESKVRSQHNGGYRN